MYDPVPWQVIGQGPPGGTMLPHHGFDHDGIGGGDLGRGFLQILQRQFELLDPGATL